MYLVSMLMALPWSGLEERMTADTLLLLPESGNLIVRAYIEPLPYLLQILLCPPALPDQHRIVHDLNQLISSSPQHPWLWTLGISQWLVTSFSKSLRWQGLLCLHMPCCDCLMSYSFLVIVLEAKDKTTYQAVMMVSCSCHHHQCWDF